MKKLILFGFTAMIGSAVCAEDMTKEAFIARSKAIAEKQGREVNLKVAEAIFAKKDVNKDGLLSPEELKTPVTKKAE
jgi:lactam utilization protein B